MLISHKKNRKFKKLFLSLNPLLQVITLDLANVVTSVSGPKRPHDRVSVSDMQVDFRACLTNKVSIYMIFVLLKNLCFMFRCI